MFFIWIEISNYYHTLKCGLYSLSVLNYIDYDFAKIIYCQYKVHEELKLTKYTIKKSKISFQ